MLPALFFTILIFIRQVKEIWFSYKKFRIVNPAQKHDSLNVAGKFFLKLK